MSRHRVLMLGAGGMAETWLSWFLPEVAERCEVVAIVDVDRVALEKQGRARGLWPQACFEDMAEAFAAVRDGRLPADCAVVVVPPEHHRQAVVGSLDAGLHVLVEKPLAETWEDCLTISAAVRDTHKVAVVQNYRYSAAVLAATRMVAAREFGDPYAVSARFRVDYRAFGSWDSGRRHRMSSPVLRDAAVHHLDQIRHLTGRNFEELTCDEWLPPAAAGSFAGGTCVQVLGRLGGGVRASYEGNVVCAGEPRDWMHEEYRVECADGALNVLGEQLFVERVDGGVYSRRQVDLPPMPVRYHLVVLGDFLDWLDGGEFRGVTVDDNLETMRAVCAARIAAREHRWVRLSELETNR
jgi:predicted dehydrogenase